MRAWFASRNRRERVLVAAFTGLVALTWLVSATGRLRAGVSQWRSTRGDLAAQQLWLDRQQAIETQSAAAVRDLDPARTYDATRLVATITSLASAAGLTPAIDTPATQRTPQFAYHTAKVTFRRASLPMLLHFYDDLAKQAPYLNLEAVTLQTDRAATGALNATMQISAPQIVK